VDFTHLNLSGNHSIIHLYFVLYPFHLNYCYKIPLLSSLDHKGLLVLLHNDVVIKDHFPILQELFGVTLRQILI